MKSAPLPADEAERLQALHAYGVLDGAKDEALSALVRVASSVCEAPISLLSLVDAKRQFFAASAGLAGVTETPREIAFCAHAIHSREIMVVEDAAEDDRFADNPFVTGDPGVRFYAGCPLVDREGFALGTLCVIDRKPRTLSPLQANVLRELSTAVVRILEAKKIDNMLFEAEMAAKGARADLAMVLDSVSATVAYWDTNLRNRFANAAFLESIGRSNESVRGRDARAVFGEERFARDQPFMEAALRGEPQRVERAIEDPAGFARHILVTYNPDVRDGRVLGFIATAADVTDLKAALLMSEQRTALLTMAEDVANVGHWRFELGDERLLWSPQVYRIYGRDPATFVPTRSEALAAYHPEDRERVADLVKRAVEEHEPFEFELRLIRPDGSTRRVECKGRSEIDPGTGSVGAVVGVFQDVTERHALREQLARRERLVTTGTLAAGVGHEINNPLTYVSANVDFAIDEVRVMAGAAPSSRTRELLEVLGEAREGADRIRKIVRGLRAFAREDAPMAATDVRAALEISMNMAVHEVRSNATFVTEIDDDVPHVFADESRLSQVFVNLFVNAAQAFVTSDPERNRIIVRAKKLADGRIGVEVEDNGPGIAADVLPRIFDPFFTTKDVGRGTGLGLAICHNIVASFGGEITCSTRHGSGSTFRVVLAAAVSGADAGLAGPPRQVIRGRVLVIDDEPAVLRTIERTLRDEQEVVCIGDAREACRVLDEGSVAFDVVFCDLMMPHMTGMELYQHALGRDPALAARFVFLTGGAVDEAVRRFLADVPNERLEKPFSNQNLRGVARRYADVHGAGTTT